MLSEYTKSGGVVFCKTIDHQSEFVTFGNRLFSNAANTGTQKNISFPKQAVRLAVMKQESTAFRFRGADVCWQALPVPV